jgi:hypothetical protein
VILVTDIGTEVCIHVLRTNREFPILRNFRPTIYTTQHFSPKNGHPSGWSFSFEKHQSFQWLRERVLTTILPISGPALFIFLHFLLFSPTFSKSSGPGGAGPVWTGPAISFLFQSLTEYSDILWV